MSNFLMFHLYGPMASWGNVAVGEYRPTETHPGKSAIIGLLAAALGVRRDEEQNHQRLAESYGMAVRVNTSGELLRDYHTSQVPPEHRNARYHTRREELAANKLSTILSQRDYRIDACYTIAIWSRTATAPHTLSDLAAALQRPCFTLYLGRKSCPLSIPVMAQVVSSANLKGAFEMAGWQNDFLDELPKERRVVYYWEELDEQIVGMSADMAYPRRDQPLSRCRWQFRERREFYRAESIREVST